jgi:hypothetical protein
MGNDQICSSTSQTIVGILTTQETCQTNPSSTSYELIQAQIQTQYYIQNFFDATLIIVVAIGIVKILTWKNWLYQIVDKLKK